MINEASNLSRNARRQFLTSFPNQNEKHIDFVIAYKPLEVCPANTEALNKRSEFFNELKKESFDVFYIDSSTTNDQSCYALLHCHTERLLKEAEAVRLKMQLKNVQTNESCVSRKICQNKKTDELYWATYDPSIKFLFEGVGNKEGPFNTCTRILLVDTILKNLTFSPESEAARTKINKYINSLQFQTEESMFPDITDLITDSDDIGIDYNKGLPAMINKGYFAEAFPLHDQSETKLKYFCSDEVVNILKLYKVEDRQDDLFNLYKKWARFRKIFNFQPLTDIRNYFGEFNAMYYAWVGSFICTLIIPALIGLVLSVVGQIMSIQGTNSLGSLNINSIGTNFTLMHLIKSFDNDLSPIYAVIICLWGAIFMESWKRKNHKLAADWNVRNFETYEPDLPDYVKKKEEEERFAKKDGDCGQFFLRYSKIFKYIISLIVIIFMMCIVVLEIILIVIYRLYITKKVYPNDELMKKIFGDLTATAFKAISTLLLSAIFNRISVALTNWENHRTRTMFKDALITKLFAFEFINNYGALFYLAYLRNIKYTNGLFNLGVEFNDECAGNDCMSLLTIQVFTLLIAKPLLRFLKAVIKPCLSSTCKNKNKVGILPAEVNNETAVSLYISTQRNRSCARDMTAAEFTEKVIFFGYLILFACSLYVGPLIMLIVLIIDLRVDAKSLILLHRRPIGYKAQDIGSWLHICRLMNIIGIINNGFLIGFTSEWSKTFLRDNNEKRFYFILIFEHTVFFAWFLIILLLPDVPYSVQNKVRYEYQHVKEIISAAKHLKYELCRGNTQCVMNNMNSSQSQDEVIEKLINGDYKDNRIRLPELKNKSKNDPQSSDSSDSYGEGSFMD